MTTEATPFEPPPAARRAGGVTALVAALRVGLRLALFIPVRREVIPASLALLLALVALELALAVGFGWLRVVPGSTLDIEELHRGLGWTPLILLCGVACAWISRDRTLALRIPVALTAIGAVQVVAMGIAIWVLSRGWIGADAAVASYYLGYASFVWWAGAVVVALFYLVRIPVAARLRAIACGIGVLVVPAWWIPGMQVWIAPQEQAQSARWRSGLVTEEAFYAQHHLLDAALNALAPERPGIADVYVLTAALYASEDVFMKEVGVITELLRDRFDARERSVSLVNNPRTLSTVPLATVTSLRRALAAIGERMNPDEDVLLLYLTSHGSEQHRLAVDLWPLQLAELDPPTLKRALDAAGIRWRVIVISACYSGGYVEPLRDEHTLIITAASATRQSFGCGAESDFTYLAKALFDEALRDTLSIEQAFARARASIAAREREQGFLASEPQIFVGEHIRERLRALEERLRRPNG